MKTTVYLIRHSEQMKLNGIKNIEEDSQISNEKIVLTVKGEKLAKKLSKSKELKHVDEIWSSNYCRAISTAKYICEQNKLNLNVDSRLNERKLGNLEELRKLGDGKTGTYVQEQLKDENLSNTGGESRKDVNNRLNEFFNDILEKSDNKKIVVVSHGAAIKYYLVNYCEIDENYELKYNNNKLIINSPCMLKLDFEDKRIVDIKQII